MKVAIPSYQRFDILKNKSLALLQKLNIPMDTVYVFCVEEEYEQYKQLPCHVVIGKHGLREQRNFIIDYFEEGEELLCMDDDLESIDGNINFEEVFQTMRGRDAYLAGIYPCFNPFFRAKQKLLTTDLRFIIGCFYFCINRHDMKEQNNFANKDDYSRTIRYYQRDGIVLRYNQVAVKTKHYSMGGLGKFNDRLEQSKKECELFQSMYPCKIKTRKNGMSEIILIK
jgi:hypothetical protein